MLPLLGGFAILCGLLLLFYLFVNADPARLARIVKWAAIIVAVFAVIALIWSERFSMFLAPIAVLLPLWRRMRSMMSGLRGPSAARDSTVETRFIRMTLDHDTGTMSGTVLEGRFAGMRLEELRPADLLALLRECRAEDEEAYAILGLAPGADAEAIKAAHHRLMKQLHPDHGGTDYLASKINRARDVLLHR